jgi:Fe-S oxidoreductase
MSEANARREAGGPSEIVPVFIMGKCYRVPDTLTIQKALEYAGYRLIRGCGCRGGICGACGTVYRLPGSFKIQVGLACQTMVEPNMYIAQIPFFPAVKSTYDLERIAPTGETVAALYPELYKCMGCNTCTRSCPMDIEVMEYISAALRGDLQRCAELSFDCVMCGLCSARCPAELVQYNIAILARRLTAKYLRPKAGHVEEMVRRMRDGKYEGPLNELMNMDDGTLRKLYASREIEPNESSEEWRPADAGNL